MTASATRSQRGNLVPMLVGHRRRVSRPGTAPVVVAFQPRSENLAKHVRLSTSRQRQVGRMWAPRIGVLIPPRWQAPVGVHHLRSLVRFDRETEGQLIDVLWPPRHHLHEAQHADEVVHCIFNVCAVGKATFRRMVFWTCMPSGPGKR